MEGKRKRKATKQYNIEPAVPKKKVKHIGSGTKLQDIPSGINIPHQVLYYCIIMALLIVSGANVN